MPGASGICTVHCWVWAVQSQRPSGLGCPATKGLCENTGFREDRERGKEKVMDGKKQTESVGGDIASVYV